MNNARLSRGPYRLVCDFDLEFDAPLHVGSGERFAALTDLPILRLPSGSPWLPGSGLRGAVRDWCEREAPLLGVGTESIHRLFGTIPKARCNADRQGRITIEGNVLEGGSTLRDHVAIDERWGAGSRGGKFDEEVLHAKDARVRWTYEGDGPSDPEVRLLKSVAWALERGLIALGGRKANGFGRVTGKPYWNELHRDNAVGVAAYLAERLDGEPAARGTSIAGFDPYETYAGAPEPDADVGSDGECQPWSILDASVRIQFEGPMLVAATVLPEDSPFDDSWLTGPGGAPLLPGSSLRGVLRQRAYRIARTLGEETGSQAFERAADLLWGWADRDGGQRGLVSVGDGALAAGEDVDCVPLSHVAVDRITHFPADGKLFFVGALASPAFVSPLLVRWHDSPLPDAREHKLALALLLFTLRDLEEGLIWAGSRTTRGYGFVASSHVEEAWCSRVLGDKRDSAPGKTNGSVAAIARHAVLEDAIDEWAAHLRSGSAQRSAEPSE